MRTSFLATVLITSSLFLTACGGGGDTPAPPPGPGAGPGAGPGTQAPANGGSGGAAQDTAPKAWSDSAGTATLSGGATFKGDAPTPVQIKMDSDPKCVEMNSDGFADASVLVDANGGLQNVFVYVSKGLEAWTFTVPEEPVILDQKGCNYTPRVVGMMTGQTLRVRNSDPTVHNVHTYPKRNRGSNVSQPAGSKPQDIEMKRGEVLIPIKCDMHPWMQARVGVVDHPFFVVTAADGSFTLPKLPAGEYTISAEHEVFGKAGKQTLTIGDGENQTIAFEFSK
jgi:plastocyanin